MTSFTQNSKKRQIALDVETTGLDPKDGHRVIEIGAVEMVNYIATGRTFHVYINPMRVVPPDATAIHGLTNDFLNAHPVFEAIVDDFLAFIHTDQLVIHNARFDVGFLNAELGRFNKPLIKLNETIDTVWMARRKFPGAPANLDALCRRFKIDNSKRDKHGALVDAKLLAEVYLNLMGGRQLQLALDQEVAPIQVQQDAVAPVTRTLRPARSFPISPVEQAAHEKFIATIANSHWKDYI